jgi:seryl-tRNA synthetase
MDNLGVYMLDLKSLRYDLENVVQKLATRGYQFNRDLFLQLESQRKALQTQAQKLQQESNELAKILGSLKQEKPHADHQEVNEEYCLARGRALKKELHVIQEKLQNTQQELENFLLGVPNLPDESVSLGRSSEDNPVIRTWGNINKKNFALQDHVTLTAAHQGMMDFESAASITGSRFVVLRGMLARLERALINWMLDTHTQKHGYEEVAVPYIVNKASLQSTGQLPLFENDLFKLQNPNHWYLVPTGEVPLTNLARDRIFNATQLPCKYVSYTPCFRSEAGSYGRDVRGMIRQHQFDKVELVHLVEPSQAEASFECLTRDAESILQCLELPYRVVSLCTADLGFAATKTYDLEVWMPGQNTFREISSCSYMGDFQARRLKARFRCPDTQKLLLIHTLNGSGLAVGRTLVAILENYQQEDGGIQIPTVLQSYMGGISRIPPQR